MGEWPKRTRNGGRGGPDRVARRRERKNAEVPPRPSAASRTTPKAVDASSDDAVRRDREAKASSAAGRADVLAPKAEKAAKATTSVRRSRGSGTTAVGRRESKAAKAARAAEIVERLAGAYPGGAPELCALVHDDPFELLVATILSAQCTDERVNLVAPAVFARYRTPEDLAGAEPSELEALIRSTGFFRSKTQSLIGMARAVTERFDGEIPRALEDLVSLPGVGRKTANVVRSVAFSLPGLPVDTHVLRLSRRLGLTAETDPVKVESDLCALVPAQEWGALSLRLILHGRQVCVARTPRCGICILSDRCPSAQPVPERRTPASGARLAR